MFAFATAIDTSSSAVNADQSMAVKVLTAHTLEVSELLSISPPSQKILRLKSRDQFRPSEGFHVMDSSRHTFRDLLPSQTALLEILTSFVPCLLRRLDKSLRAE